MALDKLIVYLRTAQLFYHDCHNKTKGPSFAADHGLFSDFYGQAEGDYDSVAERFIGLNGSEAFDSLDVIAKAAELLGAFPKVTEAPDMFKVGLGLEQSIVNVCEQCDKDPKYSAGTRDLTGGIADAAEVRIYKIKQRTK